MKQRQDGSLPTLMLKLKLAEIRATGSEWPGCEFGSAARLFLPQTSSTRSSPCCVRIVRLIQKKCFQLFFSPPVHSLWTDYVQNAVQVANRMKQRWRQTDKWEVALPPVDMSDVRTCQEIMRCTRRWQPSSHGAWMWLLACMTGAKSAVVGW